MRGRNDQGKTQPRRKKRTEEDADDEVGYGKPPRAHQFKPGKSGNPKGRPKGAKSEETFYTNCLAKRSASTSAVRREQITVHEGILRRIVEDCLKGNTKSAAFLLNRFNAITSGEPEESGLSEDEKAVLEGYLQGFQPKPKSRED